MIKPDRLLFSLQCCVVMIGALLLTLPWLDRPFFSRGEPREALVAQSMMMSGNWISPQAYDGAVPSKPPFNHWLMLIASLPIGEVTETTARLPTAICFIVFMIGFFAFVSVRTSPQSALVSCLILLSSPEWIRSAVSCRVDLLLATTMVGGLLALFEWEKTNRFRYLAWAWIFLSAATLTKGPIGLVIPVGIFGFWSLVTRGISLRTVVTLIGQCALVGAPVLLAASSWYIAAYMLRGPDFLDKVLEENVRRFAGTMEDEPHKHSFLFLLGTYVVGFAPWSIPWLVELWRRKQSLRSVPSAVTGWWLRQDRFLQFCALAVVVITLFFCLPDSKRSVYLLPAYPFVAVMLAGVIEAGGQISRKIARSFEVVTVVVAAGVCGVGFLWVAADASGIPLFSAYSSLIGALPPWRLVVVLALCGAWWLVLKRALPVGIETGLARSIVTVAVVTNLFVIGPVSEGLSPKGKLDAAPIAATIAQADGQPLLSFGTAQYAASFYLRRPFRRFVCSDQSGLVFVERRSMDDLEQLRGAAVRELAHIPTLLERQNREIVLVEAAPRVDGAGERRCIR